jgi:hypothetical protein
MGIGRQLNTKLVAGLPISPLPMMHRSTRLKIAFFSLILAGFMVIQYCWVLSLQKDKSEEYKYRIIHCINDAGRAGSFTGSIGAQKDTTITNLLRRSFSFVGLGALHFDYSIDSGAYHLALKDISQQQKDRSSQLTLQYLIEQNVKTGQSKTLTVVIPSWHTFIWKKMTWTIAASVLLTIMILVIFYYTSVVVARNQRLLYDDRTKLIKTMLQQLEAPLSTVSVAAEALRNARVMRDAGKIQYYQQVINEENKRMNEEVEKLRRTMQ